WRRRAVALRYGGHAGRKNRLRHQRGEITVGTRPVWVAVTPDGKTALVANNGSDTVSTIDVKTRTKDPDDIAVGSEPGVVALTPDGTTAFAANNDHHAPSWRRSSSQRSQLSGGGDVVSSVGCDSWPGFRAGSRSWWAAVSTAWPMESAVSLAVTQPTRAANQTR